MKSKEDYNKLCADIKKYQRAYYVEHKSLISDAEFDYLWDEMLVAEARFPGWVTKDSPSQVVFGDDGETVKHRVPMKSLEKTNKIDELVDWCRKLLTSGTTLVFEHKYDGLSLSLEYVNGYMVRASTRGKTGRAGADVTKHARNIMNIPQYIPEWKGVKCEVRGEALMSFDAFELYNNNPMNTDKFANPRNAASGTLMSGHPEWCKERGIKFFAWQFLHEGQEDQQHSLQLSYLKALGFEVAGMWIIDHVHQVKKYIEMLTKTRSELRFPVDGVTVKVNEMGRWKGMGSTGHHPNWAIAYKFPATEADGNIKNTKLVDVEFSVAESGRVTPVAVTETVQLYGTNVNRFSMASYKTFKEWEQTGIHVGDILTVTKGGEIIPKILSWDHCGMGREITFPTSLNGKAVTVNGAYASVEVENVETEVVVKKEIVTADLPSGNKLSGLKVVVSGDFKGLQYTRDQVESMVPKNGGKLQSSLGKSTDLLVVGPTVEAWVRAVPGKAGKAATFGTKIVGLECFLDMIK